MADKPSDAIARANAALLERMTGVPATPATRVSQSDAANPNAPTPQSGVEHSGADSSVESNRAPRRNAPALRLVWCASSHE